MKNYNRISFSTYQLAKSFESKNVARCYNELNLKRASDEGGDALGLYCCGQNRYALRQLRNEGKIISLHIECGAI